MQNIEKFFGYKVLLTDELDPARIEVLKEKAEKIRALNDFSEEEYVVYFHQMSLVALDDHFSSHLVIEEKVQRLDLNFSVNPKQVKNGKIKLYNFLMDAPAMRGVREMRHSHAINYMLQGEALANKYGFRNEIVTFVAKNLRQDHRKLKVSVTCRPTEEYKRLIHKNVESHLTQIDFKLKSKNIKLLSKEIKKNECIKEDGGERIVNNIYTNNGQVGAQGDNASTTHSTFNQQVNSNIDLAEVKSELTRLRTALKAIADDDNPDQDKAIGAITMAVEAADEGNQDKVIKYLKSSGEWALKTSEKIGTSILTAYMKATMGI